ncbi:unnamed protein product [Mytilus coruscus]|uniref:Retropepsins domain-containing protein n=1 Tax=Mytilus coruscus TaxID=42192 RepID=A0A6J8E3N0_MYTCO|nr:unnamed protein product [Mytilus coruscus]
MSDQEQKFSIQEIFSYDKNKKSKTLFIEMKVLGKTFKAVVDSAAQISVLSTSILPLLQSTIKLNKHLVLRGAGKDSKIDARYTEEIPIEIGKLKSKWRFVTANINDNIILGIDFLEKLGAVIDMANYTIRINNEAIPAVCLVGNEGEETNLYRISMKKKIVVPPHSLKIVDREIDHTPTDDIIIQPKTNLKGLLSPNVLISKDETVKAVFLVASLQKHLKEQKKEQQQKPDIMTTLKTGGEIQIRRTCFLTSKLPRWSFQEPVQSSKLFKEVLINSYREKFDRNFMGQTDRSKTVYFRAVVNYLKSKYKNAMGAE